MFGGNKVTVTLLKVPCSCFVQCSCIGSLLHSTPGIDSAASREARFTTVPSLMPPITYT